MSGWKMYCPKPRPDLLDERTPADCEILQLSEPDVPSSHVYMEAQIFTPDSRLFLFHRSAHAHGSSKDDPEHQYIVCDLDNNCAMWPITEETGATAPSVSPDGEWLYYFVNQTEVNSGRLILKRVRLDGSDRQTLFVLDTPIPGTCYRPSMIYPLSTISSDGGRIALSAFFGDGETDNAPSGLMVFDLKSLSVAVVLEGTDWTNVHPQYCRSLDPDASHDILVQENHGAHRDASGNVTTSWAGDGAEIHILRDDGTNFRNLPWGRDGEELCQGHQCWRGRERHAITSTHERSTGANRLIEGWPASFCGHVGRKTPNARRNDLSRNFPNLHFYHFATDISGKRFVSDADLFDGHGGKIFIASLPAKRDEPISQFKYLLSPRTSSAKSAHPHPCLSPDGSVVLFNSDESGILQAYLVRNLPWGD